MSDTKQYKFVIDNGDEYVCICGQPHFCMKKTYVKTPSPSRPDIINSKERFDVNAMYNDSNICSWPVPDAVDLRNITSIIPLMDNTIVRGDGSGILISALLCRINALRKNMMNYCYLYWRADRDMYMSRLPADILRIIINFTTFNNTF